MSTLKNSITERNFPAVLEFSKNWDLEFRKAKMGKAKKELVNSMADEQKAKEAKERMQALMNAVTFDLIGINKSVRKVGEEDVAAAEKLLLVLEGDIRSFINLEPSF